MPYTHKLSRRLATLYTIAAAALAIGCADSPTSTSDAVPLRPSTLDPSLALTASTTIGSRITTDRYVQVFGLPSRNAAVIGTQRDRILGTVVEGPSPVTMTAPYPLYRINFDTGTDGWVLGAYLSLITAPPPPPTVVVATVTLAPTSATVGIGAAVQLVATLRDAAGNTLTGRTIAWVSSNAGIASVSATGNVTGVVAGNATVTATSEGRSASAAITVSATPPPPVVAVATVTLSPPSASLAVGSTAQMTATTRDNAGNILTGRLITWTSSNASVASVSAAGLVTGLVAGNATVTATSEGRSGASTITVQTAPPPPPPPTGNAIFASTWNTATGRATNAFLDAGNSRPWLFACCNGATNTSIVTSASLGLQNWPAGNVYRVGTQAAYPTQIMTHQIVADIGTPTPGSHRYFRYYFQMTIGDDHGASHEGNLEHGIESSESPTSSGRGMNFYRIPQNDGTWWPGYREISTGWRFIATGLRLQKNRTYRMEWHLAYGATTYRIEVRIYDEHGVLVGTEDDFFMLLPYRNTSVRMGAENFIYTPSSHRMFRIGTNGPTSGYPMQNLRDENLYLHGHVAICATTWCGPVTP